MPKQPRIIEKGKIYHVFNRGVEKRKIFMNDQDYSRFIIGLEFFNQKNPIDLWGFLTKNLKGKNVQKLLAEKLKEERAKKSKPIVEILVFCLMPNHFHLFVQQLTKDGLTPFMKAVCTNFSMYFNRKYDRIGHLFESTYKAALVETEPYYLHVTRYIHRNPKPLLARDNPLHIYPYSSYPYYLGAPSPIWLHTSPILSFSRTQRSLFPKDILSYQSFVENEEIDETEILGELTLEK